MSLSSMTGFGEASGALGERAWRIEARSVNGRGLDIRLRLPPGFELLDGPLRSAVRQKIKRGSLTLNVQISIAPAVAGFRVDEDALEAALAAVGKIRARVGGDAADAADLDPVQLLSLRGVIDVADQQEPPSEDEVGAIVATAEEALAALIANRAEEGQRLGAVLAEQVDAIEVLTAKAEASPARSPEAIRERLARTVARLSEVEGLDPERLHQEAILLATKADIREELDRLNGHVAAVRELLSASEPVGRRLDFLAQEFNREANTLCSKSNDADVTRTGIELKVVIDQMREQVQNIE